MSRRVPCNSQARSLQRHSGSPCAVQFTGTVLAATQWLTVRSTTHKHCVSRKTAWPLKKEPIGCSEMSVTTNLRCVTSQKSEDFIYTAAEARNHATRHLSLSKPDESNPRPPSYFINTSHLRLGLPSGLFSFSFSKEIRSFSFINSIYSTV